MASTTSLYTGLSGLQVHARKLDVIGNNIANVNTTAFKSSRVVFGTQFARTLSGGSPPTGETGGTNPSQVGLGVRFAGTQRDFTGGALSVTGDARDLAVDGEGFFVVERDGDTLYTRDGSFRQDLEDRLVTVNGDRVMGYSVDETFTLQTDQLRPLSIPLGKLTVAEASTTATIAGNLDAGGELPSGGSVTTLGSSVLGGFGLIAGATVPAGPGNVLEPTSLVTEILDPAAGVPTAALFAPGDTLDVDGVTRGGRVLPGRSLPITATTTVQEMMTFLEGALGTTATGGPNPDGRTPGVSLDPTTGVLTVTGNTGTVNGLGIDSGDIRVTSGGGVSRAPFVPTDVQLADGESVRTTMIVYDSLGAEVSVQVSYVLEEKTVDGTSWRYYAASDDDTAGGPELGTGTLQFDTSGNLVTPASIPLLIDRGGTGAASPLAVTVRMEGPAGRLTALADEPSEIATVFRDGLPPGRLDDFGVDRTGVVRGTFTNGAVLPLGQVVLATFPNDEGLGERGDNLFERTAASGEALLREPGSLGTATVVGGSLELSNVDLGDEFIDLILTSTGYTASSRIIRTTDELMQQLLVLGR